MLYKYVILNNYVDKCLCAVVIRIRKYVPFYEANKNSARTASNFYKKQILSKT